MTGIFSWTSVDRGTVSRSSGIVSICFAIVCSVVVVPSAAAATSDEALARQLIVTKADLGSSYDFSDGPFPGLSDKFFLDVAACVGQDVSNRRVTATGFGGGTHEMTGAGIASSVVIVETGAMARADRRAISDSKFASCVASTDKVRLQNAGSPVTSAEAEPLEFKRYGDFTVAIQESIAVGSGGQSETVDYIRVSVIKGRAELTISFSGGSGQIDRPKMNKVLKRLQRRLAKADTT